MRKYNPYVQQIDTNRRQLQVIYLYNEGVPVQQIAEITGYAVSTVRSYVRKYEDCAKEANRLFADHIASTVARSEVRHRQGRKVTIDFLQDCGDMETRGEKLVYLFKFYCGTQINSKIGTTERTITERLVEEIDTYIKKNEWAIDRVEVLKVISTRDIEPALVESRVRSDLGIKYRNQYINNDRFMNAEVSVQEFETSVNRYLQEQGILQENTPSVYLCGWGIFLFSGAQTGVTLRPSGRIIPGTFLFLATPIFTFHQKSHNFPLKGSPRDVATGPSVLA